MDPSFFLGSSASSSSVTQKSDQEFSHSPIFLLSHICTLVSVRLDSSNYVLWRFQITPILKAHSLFGFIDGSFPCPERSLKEDDKIVPNPKFILWNAQDHALMTLINATLSQKALSLVVGCTTSQQVWKSLERRYSSSTRACIIDLKSDLR